MALIPVKGNPSGPVRQEDIPLPDQFPEEQALRLVTQDAATADAFLSQKMWPLRWREIDVLYQSPRAISTWEGTTVAESNVTSYLIAKHVNSIVPQCVNGIFYDDPPFLLRPRPGTDESVIRAKTAVFSEQLDEMRFQDQIEEGFHYTVLFGIAIYKWGWLSCKTKEKRYVRKKSPEKITGPLGQSISVPSKESDEFEVEEIEKDTSRPHFEHVDFRSVLVDPGCRKPDIRCAKWVIHRMYLTHNDLDALRDQEGWDIPSHEELKSYFETPKEQAKLPNQLETTMSGDTPVAHAKPRYEKTTEDPFEQPLEVLERWDGEKVIAVLQGKKVIRNEANPFGEIPFYSSHWWRIPDSFYSLGVGHLVGQDQRVQQGLRNAALNILGLAVQPNYLRSRGANVPTQQIRQRRGGIIDVDGEVDKAFKILEVPKVPPELWAVLEESVKESESNSGADQLLQQGATQGPRTSMGRTAGGASILASANSSRLQGPVERFCKNVFEPWLYQMDELNRERLPMSTLRNILGDTYGNDFRVDEEEFLNAKLEYEVLAGAHLAARRGMAQALPTFMAWLTNGELIQLLASTGYTIDFKELVAMLFEVSEWRNTRDVVRKMTPEEQQARQQQNQEASKIQGQMQLQQQKGQQQSQLSTQKNDEKATMEVLRVGLEHALTTGQESLGGDVGENPQ